VNVKDIAEVCHEANRALCEALGDFSQKPWDKAPDWQVESAMNGVQCHMANPEVTPEQLHINWMKEKKKTGWKYGKEKDEEKKTHPCMVEYVKLPAHQKAKDHIFKAICATLLKG